MSKHIIPVVRIDNIEPHPNADKLEIVRVFGYTVCVSKGQFQVGDLAVYIAPDYLVPTNRPEFAFLAKEGETHHRVRVSKRRGVISQGFLIPAPDNVPMTFASNGQEVPGEYIYITEGMNLIDYYGITRYEPPEHISTGGETEKGPDLWTPYYDVENLLSYPNIILPGEYVVMTEKLHGSNSRYCYHDGRMYCGSRSEWKRQDDANLWWRALANNPWIATVCKAYPDHILYGEVFGNQNLKYGTRVDKPGFRAFDILHNNEWLDVPIATSYLVNTLVESGMTRDQARACWVPILYQGPFSFEKAKELAEQDSTMPNASHYREGVVIRPYNERTDVTIGRVQLKLVSNRFLEKDK